MHWKSAGSVGAFVLFAGMASQANAQQPGCMNGTAKIAFGVNAEIKVCPEGAAMAPELQKQIDAIERTQRGNQALLVQLTQSARSVNALTRDVDTDRQAELLRSFSRQLEKLATGDQHQTQAAIADLATKLANLQDTISQMREDDKTAQKTRAALDGTLGDSIAAFDLTLAQKQLDAIQSQLASINQNTQGINQNTKAMSEDTRAIRETLTEEETRRKAADEETRKKQEELAMNPRSFANSMIAPNTSGGYMVFIGSRAPDYPLFNDSKLSFAFHKDSGESWRVDAIDKQVAQNGEMWNVTFADVGDTATLCFATADPSGKPKVWSQHFKLIPNPNASQYMTQKKFAPVGLPEIAFTDAPCDGVAQVRPEGTPVSRMSQLQEQQKTQMDRIRQEYAAMGMTPPSDPTNPVSTMREQAMTNPAYLGNIFVFIEKWANEGGRWRIEVHTRPVNGLSDAHEEASLIDASGRATPLSLRLTDHDLMNTDTRTGYADRLGAKLVVCFTGTSPLTKTPRRITQSFSIEGVGTSNAMMQKAVVVPGTPTLGDASNAPCQ